MRPPWGVAAPQECTELLGQIVLVDHWATVCTSCISSMPRIHDTYLKYKSRGFTVVSVAYMGKRSARKYCASNGSLHLHGSLSLEMACGRRFPRVADSGFAQYMLLYRNGTLYAGTGEVDMGRNLRTLLDVILPAERTSE